MKRQFILKLETELLEHLTRNRKKKKSVSGWRRVEEVDVLIQTAGAILPLTVLQSKIKDALFVICLATC